MDRRQFNSFSLGAAGLWASLVYSHAHALTLADLSNSDATKGLKTLLWLGEVIGFRRCVSCHIAVGRSKWIPRKRKSSHRIAILSRRRRQALAYFWARRSC